MTRSNREVYPHFLPFFTLSAVEYSALRSVVLVLCGYVEAGEVIVRADMKLLINVPVTTTKIDPKVLAPHNSLNI